MWTRNRAFTEGEARRLRTSDASDVVQPWGTDEHASHRLVLLTPPTGGGCPPPVRTDAHSAIDTQTENSL